MIVVVRMAVRMVMGMAVCVVMVMRVIVAAG